MNERAEFFGDLNAATEAKTRAAQCLAKLWEAGEVRLLPHDILRIAAALDIDAQLNITITDLVGRFRGIVVEAKVDENLK